MTTKQRRKIQITIYLTLSILLLVFSVLPAQTKKAQAAPRFATALLEGRTYDQAHSTGYIDWSGTVQYTTIYHRSQTIKSADEGGQSCVSGCTEPVTNIRSGSSISGSFLRDVTYFEAMAAFEYVGHGVGTVTVSACGSSVSHNLQKPNNNTPGFNSFSVSVPAGCRAWSVSASGGYVTIRSVDAEYVTPTPTPTRTFTPTSTLTFTPTSTPTFTLTPTNTATGTPPPTSTFTNTPTNTATFMPTSTGTTAPTNTATFTATHTATFTATSTGTLVPTNTATSTLESTATFEPTATDMPPGTPIIVPVVIVMQEQNVSVSGGSGSGSLSSYAVTPTPQSSAYYRGGSCNYALRTFVYVDENEDKLMSPTEGAEGLEIVFMEASYDRLGSRYTKEGQAVFCLFPSLYGRTLRVESPYLHLAQDVLIPRNLDQDVEVWFRLDRPTLPLYLP